MKSKTNLIVLLYNIPNNERGKKIKLTLLRLGIKIKVVSPVDYDKTIEQLFSLPSSTTSLQQTDSLLTEEMMVMKGFTSAQMDQLFFALKKAGLRKIELKAILTDTNKAWTSLELYKELKKENEKMSSYNTSSTIPLSPIHDTPNP